MKKLEKNVIPLIESVYGELTPVEREVADYFLDEIADRDFSARHVSERLHVSLPSLTRFAKKCGFSGYRQFIYAYQEYEHDKPILNRTLTKQVLQDYGELLKKTYSLIDEAQFLRVGKLLDRAKRVYILW